MPRPVSLSMRHGLSCRAAIVRDGLVVLATTALFLCAAHAQPATTARPVPQQVDGAPWASLTPAQRKALKPLEAEWGRIEGSRRTKWIEIADRFPSMSPAEQARVQNRMEDWAKLTPPQRGQARMNYREVQRVPAQERQAKWEEYKALTPEQRERLAARAAPVPRKAQNEAPPEGNGGSKSNVVPNSSYAPKPKPVAPTVAQAQPGATTNLMTKRPNPPAHQQAGLPKIAVTQSFVDQSTLLPKRGPQGAATRSAAASAPVPPRQ